MIVIGDVHEKIDEYHEIIKSHSESIQVGDFGFREVHQWHKDNIDPLHKILFGNHDDYNFLHEEYSFGNYHYITEHDIFLMRGAFSIDKHRRIEGIDWFSNEELEYYSEGYPALEEYLERKPSIVITHDCPNYVIESGFKSIRTKDSENKCITRQLLDTMFDEHKPKLWIFGHHHKSFDKVIGGTRFICLDELETFNLDI